MRKLALWSSSLFYVAIFFASHLAFGLTIDGFEGTGKADSSTSGVIDVQAVSSPSAIGGVRVLYALKTGGGIGDLILRSFSGALLHSQESDIVGSSLVIWDGNNNSTEDPSGLGGINLYQDWIPANGDPSLLVNIQSSDYASGKSTELYIKVDQTDSFGQKCSLKKIILDRIYYNETISVKFTDFTDGHGSLGLADFAKVGAITLSVVGSNPGADLTLGPLTTNGKCTLVPDSTGRVIDDCGVCGGHNEAKDSCGVCFGNNASKDQCGICGGDGTSCLDCQGTPFGTAKKDACGICNGDGKSCADCNGVPHGTAQKDICGVCNGDGKSCLDCAGTAFGIAKVDRCDVCAGDGNSCLNCTESDLSALLKSLQGKTGEQRDVARLLVERIIDSNPKLTKLSKSQISSIYKQILNIILTLPTSVKDCNSSFCIKVTAYTDQVKNYKVLARKLYEIALQLQNYKLNQGLGKCRGGMSECTKRQQAQAKADETLRAYVRKVYTQNLKLLTKVPTVISQCS